MKVYVAHAYGRRHGLSEAECEANVRSSIEFGRKLILMGHNPFIPNLYHYVHKGWGDSPDEPTYLGLVSEWVRDCDALLVAKRPSWKHSGVEREIGIAHALGKEIYWDIDVVP